MARDRQRARTRKDLLQAAAKLMAEGRSPTLEDVAEAAMVSRATAYRYFPGIEPLLVEAALDLEAPVPQILLGEGAPAGLAERLIFVDDAFDAMIGRNEAALRMMLIHALQHSLDGEVMPVRQNRRSTLIEAAVADSDASLAPPAADRLAKAAALLIGTEAMLVCKDVLQLDAAEARAVRHWALAALASAARTS